PAAIKERGAVGARSPVSANAANRAPALTATTKAPTAKEHGVVGSNETTRSANNFARAPTHADANAHVAPSHVGTGTPQSSGIPARPPAAPHRPSDLAPRNRAEARRMCRRRRARKARPRPAAPASSVAKR